MKRCHVKTIPKNTTHQNMVSYVKLKQQNKSSVPADTFLVL